jgi:hypothetical protein
MNRYAVLLSDMENGHVKATVLAVPDCEAEGKTDDEALATVEKFLTRILQKGRLATVNIPVGLMAVHAKALPFTDEDFEEIAAKGTDHPNYWEALEAVVERFDTGLERKGYSLEKMLSMLPEAGEEAFRRRYGDALADKYS